MTPDLTLGIKINVDSPGGKAALESISRSVKEIGKSADSVEPSLGQMQAGLSSRLTGIASLAGKVVGTLAGLGVGVGFAGIVDRIRDTQDLDTRLKSLTKSSQDYAAVESFLSKTADEHHKNQLVLGESFSKLLTLEKAGVLDRKQSEQILLNLSDAQSALGASSTQLGQVMFGLGQALSSATVRAEEFNKVVEPLPGFEQALTKTAGLAAGELRKLINDQKISNDLFRDIVAATKEFEGASAGTANNLTAKFADVENAYQRLAKAVEQPVSSALVTLLDGITAAVNALGKAIDEHGEEINAILHAIAGAWVGGRVGGGAGAAIGGLVGLLGAPGEKGGIAKALGIPVGEPDTAAQLRETEHELQTKRSELGLLATRFAVDQAEESAAERQRLTEEISLLEEKRQKLIEIQKTAEAATARPTIEPNKDLQARVAEASRGGGGADLKFDRGRARAILDFFIAQGVRPVEASGIVGNLIQESGLDPAKTNSIGAFGLAQFLGPRRVALETFAAEQRTAPEDLKTQLLFILKELRSSEIRAAGELAKATTPAEAAVAFSRFFERPGAQEANNERRSQLASAVFAEASERSLSASVSGAGRQTLDRSAAAQASFESVQRQVLLARFEADIEERRTLTESLYAQEKITAQQFYDELLGLQETSATRQIENIQTEIDAETARQSAFQSGSAEYLASQETILQLEARIESVRGQSAVEAIQNRLQLVQATREEEERTRELSTQVDEFRLRLLDLQQAGALGLADQLISPEQQQEFALRLGLLEEQYREFIERLKAAGQTADIALVQTVLRAQAARDTAQTSTDEMGQFAIQAARNIQSNLADTLFDSFNGNFDKILSSWDQLLKRMVANALSIQLAKALFGDFDQNGSFGGLFGFLGSLFGAGAPAAASGISGAALSVNPGLTAAEVIRLGALGFHAGGFPGRGAPTFTREMPAVIFAHAPRFHAGGLPGIRANEVPVILEKGEEVLARGDPRNALNGGGSGRMIINNHFTVTGGGNRDTEAQIASAAGRGIQRALARNT